MISTSTRFRAAVALGTTAVVGAFGWMALVMSEAHSQAPSRGETPAVESNVSRDASGPGAHLAWVASAVDDRDDERSFEAETAWIAPDGTVREVRDGIWIASGERLWNYRVERVERTLMDCECYFELLEAEDADVHARSDECRDAEREVAHSTFREPGSDRTHRVSLAQEVSNLVDDETGELRESLGTLDITRVPRASFGSLLTVTACTSYYFCGAAHPNMSCRQEFWSLDGDQPTLYPELIEQVRAAGAQFRSEAFQKLSERLNDGEGEPFSELSEDELNVTAGWPVWSDGEPAVRYQFTHPVAYAGSDGKWNSYTVSERIDGRKYPRTLRAMENVPEEVADFWESRSAFDGQGFSRIAPADRERHWKRFSGGSRDTGGE